MRGQDVLARTISRATVRGKEKRAWQYHSRSDAHSKVACWSLLFDLLLECDVLRRHAEAGLLGFGINHVMVGPINKTLDLVLTRIPSSAQRTRRDTFAGMIETYGIQLDEEDARLLGDLPVVHRDSRSDVHEVAVAIEAKACMTAHQKSLPRLHAEILATGYLAKKAAPQCIAVSYSLVNAAATFVSPGGKHKVTRHRQPTDAHQVVEMLRRAIPLARDVPNFGYDVVGVSVIDCCNDGTPVKVISQPPAPSTAEYHNYERMIRSICSEYRARF